MEDASVENASDDRTLSRRSFLSSAAKAGAVAAAAPLIVPRRVVGGAGYQAPSDTLNIAGVGVGGMGANNLRALAGGLRDDAGAEESNVPEGAGKENIVALCDVDAKYAADTFKQYPDAAKYKDYRRMLDEMSDQIDGVVIATPDHTHAVVALAAMERGMAVYVQKPLTWSVAEARGLAVAAERTGVVTQMGNQGHSRNSSRQVNEYIADGAIGEVREVHVWTNRPIWPQGQDWPDVLKRKPPALDWNGFLGPAPEVQYDPAFHPFTWRGWVDWGTGALGDMGAHLIDHPYWALGLNYPDTIETRSTSYNGISWPNAAMTYYHFPERTGPQDTVQPPVELTWYDGGLMPPRPEELKEDEAFGAPGGGVLFIGSEGKLLHEVYGRNPRLLPTRRTDSYPEPPELFERVEDENHEMNWARAIKGLVEPVSPFSYAAPLTETMLLGLVSMRAGNRKIHYDAEDMRITNIPEANQYLERPQIRKGWGLEEVTAMARP